jgi:hypothetical protein
MMEVDPRLGRQDGEILIDPFASPKCPL